MSTTDEARALSIQCVAELDRGVRILDVEIASGAPRRDTLATLSAMYSALSILGSTIHQDGRPQ